MHIPQEQGGEAWLEWRNSHIGSSDIPIILGVSSYCTPHKLWKRKLGFERYPPPNGAMRRGNEMEPVVRDAFNEKTGRNYQPKVYVHPEIEWASASVDGHDLASNTIIEIKCCSRQIHEEAKQGNLIYAHHAQVQWQMFVTVLSECTYLSFFEGEIAEVNVEIDYKEIREKILPAASQFYNDLQALNEPPKSYEDFVHITDPEFAALAAEWLEVSDLKTTYTNQEKEIRDKLVEFTDDGNCCGCGISLRRIQREGNIDWEGMIEKFLKKHPEFKEDLDPQKHRNPSIGYWKIRPTRN